MTRLASAMALLALAGAGAATLTTPAQAERRRMPPPGTGTANPGLLVATEIAFARMAREDGHDKAALRFSDDEAVMFAPGPVLAKNYLAGKKVSGPPVAWQTHEVWMSCDGTVGVTRGAWQQGAGSSGYYTTIWKRQKKGVYRWVLDQGAALGEPLTAPEMLPASIADCAPAGRGDPGAETSGGAIVVERTRENIAQGSGRSDDGTLSWAYTTGPGHARRTVVSLRKGGAMQQVLSLDVPGTQG